MFNRNKYGLGLFLVNGLSAVFLSIILPLAFKNINQAVVVQLLLVMQIPTMVESGVILYYLNIARKENIDEIYLKIKKLNHVQVVLVIIFTVITSDKILGNNLEYLSAINTATNVMMVMQLPKIFQIAYSSNYENAQKIKLIHSITFLALVYPLAFYFKEMGIVYAAIMAGIAYAIIAHKLKTKIIFENIINITEGKNKYNNYIYISEIMKGLAPVGISLCINYLAVKTQSASVGTDIGLQWLIYKQLDAFLAVFMNNKMVEIKGEYSKKETKFFQIAKKYIIKEMQIIYGLLVALNTIALIIGYNIGTIFLNIWLILNRINSIMNIGLIINMYWKNFVNLIATIVSILLSIIVFEEKNVLVGALLTSATIVFALNIIIAKLLMDKNE